MAADWLVASTGHQLFALVRRIVKPRSNERYLFRQLFVREAGVSRFPVALDLGEEKYSVVPNLKKRWQD